MEMLFWGIILLSFGMAIGVAASSGNFREWVSPMMIATAFIAGGTLASARAMKQQTKNVEKQTGIVSEQKEISSQQKKISEEQLRLGLFKERKKIYDDLIVFLEKIWNEGECPSRALVHDFKSVLGSPAADEKFQSYGRKWDAEGKRITEWERRITAIRNSSFFLFGDDIRRFISSEIIAHIYSLSEFHRNVSPYKTRNFRENLVQIEVGSSEAFLALTNTELKDRIIGAFEEYLSFDFYKIKK